MKLADDVEFQLGMTLYLPTNGFGIPTSAETHVIEYHDYGPPIGVVYSIARRPGSGGRIIASTDLRHFYSSPENVIKAKIEDRRQQIAELQIEITELEGAL